ncbi:hypothetical protein [Ectobacillus polymachus]|uniref:hypothetical protein n=1 Tax=Ectobacillus polymachus TaxID=1508806 RepID=UPI003A84D777
MNLRRALHPSQIKRLHHLMFVGKYVKHDLTSFYIQCLSPIPSFLKEMYTTLPSVFSGILSNQHNESFFTNTTEAERQQMLILFRLRYNNHRLHAQIIQSQKQELASSYCIIPSPLLQKGQTREVLDRKLANGYSSFMLPKYTSDFDMPELLIKDGRLYGNIDLKPSISGTMFVEQTKEGLYLDIEDWNSYVEMQVDEQLYFVSSDTFRLLQKQLRDLGKNVVYKEDDRVKNNHVNERELQFLHNVKQLALEKELFIDELDIYNFHICLKTSPITIVGGIPGIGKSKLAQVYGEALGLRFGKDFLLVPISTSVQEPQDLLGYLHPNGTYMESEFGIISTLIEAAAHPERLFMIVFDEMNISIIEHWFTTFLSVLELDEEKRILKLYDAREEDTRVPSSVKLGRNLIFVGTVNFDETTKELSDRLLDRVNILQLKKLSFRESFLLKKSKKHICNIVSTNEYRGEWNQHRSITTVFSEEELELFDRLHLAFQKVDRSKGVSFRTVAAIASYITNIPTDEDLLPVLSREEALDIQLSQRILPKIRGIDAVVGPLVDQDNHSPTSLLAILQSPFAQEVSSFANSIGYLKQKAKELELYGYVKS